MDKLRSRDPHTVQASQEPASVNVIFSRTESIAKAIEEQIGRARNSIDAALYRLSHERLLQALEHAERRGVRIRILMDATRNDEGFVTEKLPSSGNCSVRLSHGRNGTYSKMHHKFIILDEKVLVTGSYNWSSASEEQNYENVLLVRRAELIRRYQDEFETLWDRAQ